MLDNYISWFSLHPALPHRGCQAIFIAASGTNFFARDVIRHAARSCLGMLELSASLVDFPTMSYGVDNDGILSSEDFKNDAIRAFSDLV